MIITLAHVKRAGMCAKGAREFFKRTGLIEWSEFVEKGIDSEKLIENGDAMALQVVEVAKNG